MKDLGHLRSGEQITKACYLALTLDGAIEDGLYGMDTISQWPCTVPCFDTMVDMVIL